MASNVNHAPTERASWEELHEQLTTVSANAALQGPVYRVPECILLLNAQHQIVYANAAGQQMLCGENDPAELYGCRLGEVLHCVHAESGEGEYGTASACRICNALQVILKSLTGTPDMRRCSINCTDKQEPFECFTFSMPVHLGGQNYAFVAIQDASAPQTEDELGKLIFSMRGLAARIEQG